MKKLIVTFTIVIIAGCSGMGKQSDSSGGIGASGKDTGGGYSGNSKDIKKGGE